jgi:hypothetical protein
MLIDKPWLGCFAGFESSGFDVAVGADGESLVYFKSRGKRLSDTVAAKLNYFVEEEIKGKWVRRQMQEDGFDTKQEPNPDAERVTFTATFTGDTKMEIDHVFNRSEILVSARIVDKKTSNPVRVAVQTLVGDLYRNIERDVDKEDLEDVLEEKIKKTRLEIVPVEGRAKKYDLGETMRESEKEEFESLIPELKEVQLSSERIGSQSITWTTEEEDFGSLELKQTKPLYHGFYVIWRPDPAKAGEEKSRLSIEVK